MKMRKIQLEKRLFPILVPTKEEKQKLLELNRNIDDYLEKGLTLPKEFRKNSIYRLTIMHGPKECNFNCLNYCCTEGIAKGHLDKEQLVNVIDQAADLGVNVIYWPGLGELTLSKDFWDIQNYINKKGMKSVVFTNGSVFWNDNLAKESIGMDSDQLITKARNLGIHFYVKYWNSNPKKAAEMSGVKQKEYPFTSIQGKNIPLALSKLMEDVPKERLGVETMVSQENYQDVVKNIIPTINKLKIYGYLEPVIFSGKAEGKQKDLALNQEQYRSLANIFISGGTYCEKRQCVELILVGDGLSPGIVIPSRNEDKVIDNSGRVRNIFDIFHNPYFRKARKISEKLDGCLCRAIWNGKIKLE